MPESPELLEIEAIMRGQYDTVTAGGMAAVALVAAERDVPAQLLS